MFRIWLTVELVLLLVLFGRAFAQPPTMGSMGTLPLPRIVGMNGNSASRTPPIAIDVIPKVAATNPYKPVSFRVKWRIEPHPDNREYSLFATCGSEEISSIRRIEHVSYLQMENLTVLSTCVFQVCVSRVGQKHPLCAKQEILIE